MDVADGTEFIGVVGRTIIDDGEVKFGFGGPIMVRPFLEMTGKLGSKSDRVATAQNSWARMLEEKGDYAEARVSYDQALKKMIELHGTESWQAVRVRMNVGQLRFDSRDYVGAESEFQDLLTSVRKLGGDNHPQVASGLIALAEVEMVEGHGAEAEPLLREALAIREKKLSPGHPAIVLAQVRLGESLVAQGRASEGEPILRQALTSAVNSPFPLVRWQMGETEEALGLCLQSLGRRPEAEQLMARAKSVLQHHPRSAFINIYSQLSQHR